VATLPPRLPQPRGKALPDRTEPDGRDPIGIQADRTLPTLQTDCVKELLNKLAWALGSTYRVPYGNKGASARVRAWELAKLVLTSEGYPSKIADPNK